jgi:hypothetical protein
MNARFSHGTTPLAGSSVSRAIATERSYGACNYDPLPVVLVHGDGCWLWDEHGRRYLDMMSAYSAVSHGHAHPRLVRTLVEQAQQLAVTSRAFHNPLLPRLLQRLCELTGLDRALPSRWRRSGRNGAQGRAQVGSQGQGHPGGPRGSDRVQRQLSRPLDRDRRLFLGPAIP